MRTPASIPTPAALTPRTHAADLSSTESLLQSLTAESLAARRVLVVGDVMLDRYVHGAVHRVSPEAPVPVVRVADGSTALGGAANVAASLRNLGPTVVIAGYTGTGPARRDLNDALTDADLLPDALVAVPNRRTTVKTRVLGDGQQMVRLDHEDTEAPDARHEAALLKAIDDAFAASVDAVVLSDYAKGVLSPTVCQHVIEQANATGAPVWIDPKGTDIDRYAGATVLTPNRSELARITGVPSSDLGALIREGHALRKRLDLDALIVTCGADGIRVLREGATDHFPTTPQAVFDVSGAGDAVIATLATATLAGINLNDAVRIANLAGGVIVGQIGTAPIRRAVLCAAVQRATDASRTSGACSRADLEIRLQQWRANGDRIVFTNGCFDLLHAGHVRCLTDARALGDRLVVGLNADVSVRRLKGPERPIVPEAGRAAVLDALEAVDAVVLFDENTPANLIDLVRPDVLTKGSDYAPDDIVGAAAVRSWGGTVVALPFLDGHSTTDLVRRCRPPRHASAPAA